MRKCFHIKWDRYSHIWLCNCSILNFLIYDENLIFFFISVRSHKLDQDGLLRYSCDACKSTVFAVSQIPITQGGTGQVSSVHRPQRRCWFLYRPLPPHPTTSCLSTILHPKALWAMPFPYFLNQCARYSHIKLWRWLSVERQIELRHLCIKTIATPRFDEKCIVPFDLKHVINLTASCRPLMGLLEECLPGFYIELYQKQDPNHA